MALVLSVSSLTAFADQGTSATVTLDSNSKLTFTQDTENQNVNIAPGETFTETIYVKNDSSRTADFYLSTAVIEDLETKATGAKAAGYDVKLTAGSTTLYDSTVGGNVTENGLTDVSLQDNMLIATLAKGASTNVVLTIAFDGEGLDSTDTANYANTLANLQFDFMAGYEAPTGNTTTYRTVTEKGEDTVITLTGGAAKTGDSLFIPVAIAFVLITGIVLLIVGKRKGNAAKALMIGAIAATVLVGTQLSAEASSTTTTTYSTYQAPDTTQHDSSRDSFYTVTFRPGAVGKFGTVSGNDVCEGGEYAYKTYGTNLISYSDDTGAITVEVEKNGEMPTIPTVIPNDNYVENTNWKPETGSIVTKDLDYVADYSRLVNGVEYTIEYVDAATGVSIYPAYTTLGNVGDVITASLPTVITVSDAAYYYPVSGQSVNMTLEAKDVSGNNPNTLVIRYNMEPRTTTEEVITTYVEGGIIYNIIPGAGPAAAVTPGGGAGAPVATDETENTEEEAPEDTVNITDGDTALADGNADDANGSDATDTTDITDEDVPEAALPTTAANIMWILLTVLVVAALGSFLILERNKRKAAANQATEKDEEK